MGHLFGSSQGCDQININVNPINPYEVELSTNYDSLVNLNPNLAVVSAMYDWRAYPPGNHNWSGNSHVWQSTLEDTKAIAELLELESDEALAIEAQTNLEQLNKELELWDLQQLLSGTYDTKGAVLTINAGAGGTTYVTINTGADPQAVVRALQNYNRTIGAVPLNTRAF